MMGSNIPKDSVREEINQASRFEEEYIEDLTFINGRKESEKHGS